MSHLSKVESKVKKANMLWVDQTLQAISASRDDVNYVKDQQHTYHNQFQHRLVPADGHRYYLGIGYRQNDEGALEVGRDGDDDRHNGDVIDGLEAEFDVSYKTLALLTAAQEMGVVVSASQLGKAGQPNILQLTNFSG